MNKILPISLVIICMWACSALAETYWYEPSWGPWKVNYSNGSGQPDDKFASHSKLESANWFCGKKNAVSDSLVWSFGEFLELTNYETSQGALCKVVNPDNGNISYHGFHLYRSPFCDLGGSSLRKKNDRFYCQHTPADPPCDCSTGCTTNPINLAHGSKYKNLNLYEDNYFKVSLNYFYPIWRAGSAYTRSRWSFNHLYYRIETVYDENYEFNGYALYRPEGGEKQFFQTNGNSRYFSSESPGKYIESESYGEDEYLGVKLIDGVNIYHFDANGQLHSYAEGAESYTVEYRYKKEVHSPELAETLISVDVTHTSGASLSYIFDESGQVSSVLLPNEATITVEMTDEGLGYGDLLINKILTSDDEITLHYENEDYPYALTGISSTEAGRLETYAYDFRGRAISSELEGGAERVEVSYGNSGWNFDTVTLTNALGKQSTYQIAEVGLAGVRRVVAVDGHASANCEAALRSTQYDANGAIISKTDWEGNVTTYTRDNLGRELTRTEAAGTPSARAITTEWHPTLNVPVKVAAPESVTDYSYDSSGRLLGQKVTPVASP